MTVLEMAKEAGLRIIPVVNKIDSPLAKVDDTKEEIMKKILGCEYEDIYAVSGKTGEGVMELFEVIAREIPEPKKLIWILMVHVLLFLILNILIIRV